MGSTVQSPLRIGLTRPSGANDRLRVALEERGFIGVEVPLVAISVLPGAVDALVAAIGDGEGVWIAATSANATEAVARAVAELGSQPPLGVIGPATAAAAQHRALNVAVRAHQPTARSLAQSIAGQQPKKVVWSQAQDPLPDLGVELRAKGIEVVEVPTYATTQATVSVSDRASLLACHLVTVASPSAVASLAQLGAVGEIPPLLSIGPTTTAAAHDAHFEVLGEAETPSLEAMVAVIVASVNTLGERRLGR